MYEASVAEEAIIASSLIPPESTCVFMRTPEDATHQGPLFMNSGK
jgi:hypothetical protein